METRQLHIVALTIDPTIRQILEPLGGDSYRVDVVGDSSGLLSVLQHRTELILIDEASDPGYLAVIRRARRTNPSLDAFVVGGPKSEEVHRSNRDGGVDTYFARPIDPETFRTAIQQRIAHVSLKSRAGLVGRSDGIEEIVESVLQIAPTEVPILLEGESGTGKDVIARAVHMASRRAGAAFEAVNCGALAEGVLESELFGHEKGAFTGAAGRRAGLFERADGGTVFLDEVGETSPNMQVRLLRVLETGEVMRVGGGQSFRVDVRIIAATNRNLTESVRDGTFRQDLFYRLKGISLRLPPLRERRDDISLLVQYFIAQANRRHQKSVRGVEPGALRRLQEHPWPGNIRELRNVVDTMVVLTTGTRIPKSVVDAQLDGADPPSRVSPSAYLPVPLGRSKDEAEREMIYASILALHHDVREILRHVRGVREPGGGLGAGMMEIPVEPLSEEVPIEFSLSHLERAAIKDALDRYNGNRRRAADALGISERTLYRKIKEYGLI